MAVRSPVVAAAVGVASLFAAAAGPVETAPLRRLSRESVLDAMPAWTPDGRRIIFHSRHAREESRIGPTRNLWAVPAAGGEPVRLSDGLADEYHPAVSPDGRKIAFVSEASGSRDIWVMGADGSNPVPLTDDSGLEDHPAWSPDGRRIAYVALPKEGGNLDLWLMNDDGSAKRKVTFTAANEVFPVWHPDGRTIAFVTDAAGQFDVHGIRPDEEGPAFPILAGPDHETRPAFSPTGHRLAFARWGVDESGDAARIWIADADGSVTAEAGLPPGSTHPAWSPAGGELAFQRRIDGRWEIWTARLPDRLIAGARLDAAHALGAVRRDVLALRDGTRLEGTLGTKRIGLRTSYGRIEVEAEDVATVDLAAPERGTARLRLRNGDAFSGFLENETLELAGARGPRRLRVERVERVELRARGDGLASPPVRVAMRNGDTFRVRLRSPLLRLRIGGQELELPFAEVARVDFGEMGERSRVLTRKGERMTATVENPLVEVELATGLSLGLHPASIRSVSFPEGAP